MESKMRNVYPPHLFHVLDNSSSTNAMIIPVILMIVMLSLYTIYHLFK